MNCRVPCLPAHGNERNKWKLCATCWPRHSDRWHWWCLLSRAAADRCQAPAPPAWPAREPSANQTSIPPSPPPIKPLSQSGLSYQQAVKSADGSRPTQPLPTSVMGPAHCESRPKWTETASLHFPRLILIDGKLGKGLTWASRPRPTGRARHAKLGPHVNGTQPQGATARQSPALMMFCRNQHEHGLNEWNRNEVRNSAGRLDFSGGAGNGCHWWPIRTNCGAARQARGAGLVSIVWHYIVHL